MDRPLTDALTHALADRYAVERELGRGGMATVFLARDLKHDRRVAIKVLEPELGAVLGHERFQAEIKVTAALQHPNLLPLFDSGEAAGQLFYVMPYVQGETLRARLERERQLPVDEALRIITAIAGALDYAHGHGVIHRDLKPENILLQAGQPVLADFGIALAVSNAGGARVTQTGLSLGTPQYMSPEQATGERQLDARSDQYSLAAVAYELLAGEPPHTGGTAQIILARLLTEAPRPVNATRASVPAHISAALAKALSKAPADRFATTSAFALALAAPAVRQSGPVPRWMFRALVAAGVMVAAAAGLWFARDRLADKPLDQRVVLVLPTATGGNASLAAHAAMVDDAIAQQFSQLAWVRVQSARAALATDADAVAEARAAGAATVAVAALLANGDGAQLRMRLLDAHAGNILRQLSSATLARAPSPREVQDAVSPLIVATGFATSPSLGPVTMPSGEMPALSIFREFEGALSSIGLVLGTTDFEARVLRPLQRCVEADSTFLQAKLWLGFEYGWGPYIARSAGGAQRSDTVDRWVSEAQRRGTAYESALGRVAQSNYSELGDAVLDPIRQLLTIDPNSPLQVVFPTRLLELNRPQEALREKYATWRNVLAADTANPPRQAGFWSGVAEDWHYVGRYDSALVAVGRARAIRPTDATFLGQELQALAALGWLDTLRVRLPEVESAASNGALFGFAGNTYLTVASELVAHGHPVEGRELAERALRWFEQNDAQVRRSVNIWLRKGIVLVMLGRIDDAEREMRGAAASDTADVRPHGMLGRIYAMQGKVALMNAELRWLEARPGERLQGTTTYERAAITVNRGREYWPEAVSLLDLSLRQGQGFGIRRRLHWFGDWQPLADYPPFRRLITPGG
ncbi:MAG: serine/threonine-protein kinase [Gemmatimonadota bacterium]|nr:serine/threonine-protein kinase [Gemmatimonadota bacterium]